LINAVDFPNPFATCRRIGYLSLSLSIAVLLAGCGTQKAAASGKGGGRGDFAIPVTVARATQRDVPIQAEVIGSVEASSSVVLKPQISGQILDAHFKEGDFVKQGQLMLTIDPRALEAQLNQLQAAVLKDQAALGQAQAALVRDQAQQANAKKQLDRAAELWKGGIISKEQYEQYVTTEATFAATLTADEAAIENAKAQIASSRAAVENQKVQLGYTKIYAPISGRTGTLVVKPGNVVQANTTELATINQVQPVFVTFALPEVHLSALRRQAGEKLPVTAVPEEGGAPQTGALAFFENTVDPTTGTVRLKATFDNRDRVLWPGQFVRVTLKLGERPNAVLIPSQAVQSGQDGTFVYVVKPDQRVDIRQVAAIQRIGDESVIDRGIEPGETVVTEGTLRLVPGARVQERQTGSGNGAGRRGPDAARGSTGNGPRGGRSPQ
jgi:multidrug efflux system membrane fusion protein